MNLPSNFQFSQGSLQDFIDCPRRFQLKYIDQLAWPALETEPAMENENYLQRGANFHRLVQQYLLGVSPSKLTPLAEEDHKLAFWWENFLSSAENLIGLADLPDNKRFPEIALTTPLKENRLVGKFDLLAITDDQFIIYDWKTTRNQPKRAWVQEKLQTRVYPTLLVKAGSFLNNGNRITPSQVIMVYWYANFPTSPISFYFNDQRFNEDLKLINDLIEEISLLDESSAEMTKNDMRCRFCVYRSLCNRGIKAGSFDEIDDDDEPNLTNYDLDFEQIAEIEF